MVVAAFFFVRPTKSEAADFGLLKQSDERMRGARKAYTRNKVTFYTK